MYSFSTIIVLSSFFGPSHLIFVASLLGKFSLESQSTDGAQKLSGVG